MKKLILIIICMVITGLSIQAQNPKDLKKKKPNTNIRDIQNLNTSAIKLKTDQFPNLTGVYSADQNTFYYVKQVGNQVYWYAENKELSVTEIAYGTRERNTLTMTRVSTPKNKATQKYVYGSTTWVYNKTGKNITENSSTNKVISKVERQTDKMHFPVRIKNYRYWKTSQCNELEGEWFGTDGSTYYTVATNGKLIWFGELGHYKEGPRSNFWTNVFVGDLTQLSDGSWDAEGTFMDVPKGTATGSGRLKVNIKNNRITAYPGAPFGTKLWIRQDLAYIRMEITRLKALSDGDLDWRGMIAAGDQKSGMSKNVGPVEISDGNPGWKVEGLHSMQYVEWLDDYNVVKIGFVNMLDEDGFLAGEEDDVIDINPIPNATTLELYMDFERNIYAGFQSERGLKLEKVGVSGRPFTIRGDINASNPGSRMEVGQITIKVTDVAF